MAGMRHKINMQGLPFNLIIQKSLLSDFGISIDEDSKEKREKRYIKLKDCTKFFINSL